MLAGKNKDRIHDGELDKLTMTALRIKSGASPRTSIPHDFKVRFPRISQNEMNECRQLGYYCISKKYEEVVTLAG